MWTSPNPLHVRHAPVESVVDHDEPTRIDLDTDVFEIEAFDVWSATDGDQHNTGLGPMERRLCTAEKENFKTTHHPSSAASVEMNTFP
jgi:hypothetical protein